MLDRQIPDLTFQRIPTGSHGTPWDLRTYLYAGGAGIERRKVPSAIQSGDLGPPLLDRLPLMVKLHELIVEKLEQGGESAISTVIANLKQLTSFFSWAEANGKNLKLEAIRRTYLDWVESLVYRYQIKKDLLHTAAYNQALTVGRYIALSLDSHHSEPGRGILSHTRMRSPDFKKRVLGSAADKQKLDELFVFGHFMADLCDGLNADAVRGPLPLSISLRDGQALVLKADLKSANLDPALIRKKRDRDRAQRSRAPLAAGDSAIDHRPILLNIRIEAELLTFIAQTGLNLSQASKLKREQFRWKIDGDEMQALRAYKGRRGGEVIFRCYRAYRPHLKRYIAWLEEMHLHKNDERLFPIVYHQGNIPPAHKAPTLSSTTGLCRKAGIKRHMPRMLRKARINWLLRRSRDPQLTADMAAHSKETLLLKYEEPHHQSAAVDILRFHQTTDPTLEPPGPGLCVDLNHKPKAISEAPAEAPQPDCISADGCLFCVHHRDVMSAEYCWKLTCHSRLKNFEAALYKPSKSHPPHPAHAVIDRIEEKLEAVKEGGGIREQWVKDARDNVRAGHYHPLWRGHIELMESLHEHA